jgi:hypothetical protein
MCIINYNNTYSVTYHYTPTYQVNISKHSEKVVTTALFRNYGMTAIYLVVTTLFHYALRY